MQKIKPFLLWTLLATITTLSPIGGTACYANIENIKWGLQGTVLLHDSYIVSERDGLDTVKLIESQKAEISALYAIVAEKDAQIDRLLASVTTLDNARLAERAEWSTKVARLTAQLAKQKGKRFALGAYGGYGVQGWTVGVGLMYKVLEF